MGWIFLAEFRSDSCILGFNPYKKVTGLLYIELRELQESVQNFVGLQEKDRISVSFCVDPIRSCKFVSKGLSQPLHLLTVVRHN